MDAGVGQWSCMVNALAGLLGRRTYPAPTLYRPTARAARPTPLMGA